VLDIAGAMPAREWREVRYGDLSGSRHYDNRLASGALPLKLAPSWLANDDWPLFELLFFRPEARPAELVP
jgi:hypothetical protein